MRHKEKPQNKKRYDRIVKLYHEGHSSTKIGAMVGCTPSGVMYVLKNRRVRMKDASDYAKPTPEYSLRIRAFAESIVPILGTGPGTSAAALSRKAGYLPGTVLIHLRAMGIAARQGMGEGNVKLNIEQVQAIKGALVRGGTTQAKLAAKYKVGNSTIWAIACGQSWPDVPWPGGKPYVVRSRQKKRAKRAKSG